MALHKDFPQSPHAILDPANSPARNATHSVAGGLAGARA